MDIHSNPSTSNPFTSLPQSKPHKTLSRAFYSIIRKLPYLRDTSDGSGPEESEEAEKEDVTSPRRASGGLSTKNYVK